MKKYDFILDTIPIEINDVTNARDYFEDFPKRGISKLLLQRFGSIKNIKKSVNFISTGGRNSWNSLFIFNDKYLINGDWKTLPTTETDFQQDICTYYRIEEEKFNTPNNYFSWQDDLKKEYIRFLKMIQKKDDFPSSRKEDAREALNRFLLEGMAQ